MAIRDPIEYRLTPKHVDPGLRWIKLTLKNTSQDELTSLDVRLNTLDTYSIGVLGTGSYIVALRPGQEKERAFQISANLTGRLYASLDGWRNGAHFHWETPGILITVGDEIAELENLFAMTEPYPPPGRKIHCEAHMRALADAEDLSLQFWADTPGGEFKEVMTVDLGSLSAGEEKTYTVDVTPEEEGSYAIHSYLYDKSMRRIGHEVDYVYVVEPEKRPAAAKPVAALPREEQG